MKSMEVDAAYELHQSYTASGVEYSNPCDERDDHGYASLHDMVDMDVHSNPETLYPQSVTSGEKADISSSSEMFSPTSVQTTFSTLSSTHHPNIDLDSSVSNLSWLHNLQQQLPENNGDPNLMVNPQTGTPVTSSVSPGNQTVRVVTVPNNVHISQNSNIKYLTVPGNTTKQLYISSNRSIVSQQQVVSRPALGYQQHSYNAGTIPSSTVPDNPYPKPAYSYSCLIALSLKNSRRGSLPVAEIYNFMMTNFPYFKTAPDGWKNSVRHNLSLNKCFEKIENPNADGTHSRKGCLWTMNPAKIKKMDEEIAKWNKKDLIAIKRSMANPDLLDVLTKGQGAYLMEKAHPVRHSYQTSQYPQRPGIRIVTAVQNPQKQSVLGHIHRNQIHPFERHQFSEQTIDFNKLAQDAAEMFGDHDEFSLDPSLADFTFQNGMLEELQGEMFEMNGSSNYMISSKGVSPMTSPHKSQAYNPNAILPIY